MTERCPLCYPPEHGGGDHAILNAVLAGGDTDTIAAMTGALVGAHCGEGAIPSDWRSRLEAGPAQRREARSLAELL